MRVVDAYREMFSRLPIPKSLPAASTKKSAEIFQTRGSCRMEKFGGQKNGVNTIACETKLRLQCEMKVNAK